MATSFRLDRTSPSRSSNRNPWPPSFRSAFPSPSPTATTASALSLLSNSGMSSMLARGRQRLIRRAVFTRTSLSQSLRTSLKGLRSSHCHISASLGRVQYQKQNSGTPPLLSSNDCGGALQIEQPCDCGLGFITLALGRCCI